MNQDPLDYQVLLQDALRGLVRRSLEIVAEHGLTGDHHFFIAFLTDAPGVVMPPHLRESYPDEMTIVLKTQFKDLTVTSESFSVGLYFSSVLYYLTVPFAAIVAFTDPAASFQLQFELPSEDVEQALSAEEDEAAEDSSEAGAATDNVVSFAGFRKK